MNVLKRHRISLGLTQAEFARKVKVTQPCVQRWEAGTGLPSAKHVPTIARVIGVDSLALTHLIAPDRVKPVAALPPAAPVPALA